MAQFYISSTTQPMYHPGIRQQQEQEQALEMSVKKLNTMRTTQRHTHRPVNLLKTVLVYNMFKAASTQILDQMDVVVESSEEDIAAEQSWFDKCIDRMITEDEDEDEEEEEEEEEEEYETEYRQPLVGDCGLKRSSSTTCIRSLSYVGGQQTMITDTFVNHVNI